ncbi:MAG: hypothetical protein MJY93_05025 [Fibrobacter sp.]|nr:hypothetical protein [Fibrobacter sp.]
MNQWPPKYRNIKLLVVIGNSNMGKSSVIRHIGGFPKGFAHSKSLGKFQIRKLRFSNQKDEDVGLLGYCSLQEMDIDPDEFVKLVANSPNCPDKIIVPLQKVSSCKCTSKAVDYIRTFQKQGWTITASVLLEDNLQNNMKQCRTYPRCVYVHSSLGGNPVYPTNVVAQFVRKHFNLV